MRSWEPWRPVPFGKVGKMTNAPKLIIRVDDCGWTPDKEPDRHLEYFADWRTAAGLDRRPLPIVWGFIPATLNVAELQRLTGIVAESSERMFMQRSGETIAVHGWKHEPRAEVTAEQMHAALSSFHVTRGVRVPTYIAPFNAYGRREIKEWSTAVRHYYGEPTTSEPGIFLGGFVGDQQSYQAGPDPVVLERNIIHVPATPEWYGAIGRKTQTSAALLEHARCELLGIEPSDPNPRLHDSPPIILTLHLTWDKPGEQLGQFFDLVAPHVVGPQWLVNWLCLNNRGSFNTKG